MKTTNLAFALIMASFLIQPSGLKGQTNNSDRIDTQELVLFTLPKLPEQGVSKGRRQPAAPRRALRLCPRAVLDLTALVPKSEKGAIWGLTFEAHPTLWFYIPTVPVEARSAEFVLQDEEYNKIYRTSLVLPKEAGIISISLPSPPKFSLKIGQSYRWTFKVYCDLQRSSDYIFVDGIVKRVPQNRNYVNSVWYDILTRLAKGLDDNRSDRNLQESWTNLMNRIGLAELAEAPPRIFLD